MVNQASLIQNIEDIIQRDDIYEGSIPAYLGSAEDVNFENNGTRDSAGVSASGGRGRPNGTGSTPNISDDSSNYIENDPLGQTGNIDDEMDGLLDDVSEDDNLYYEDENGLWIINEELWEKYYQRLQNLLGLALMLALSLDSRLEAKRLLFETFSNLPPEGSGGGAKRTSNAECIAKVREKFSSYFNKAQMILFKKVQTHNDDRYTELMQPVNEWDSGDSWSDLWRCGGETEDRYREARRINAAYAAALQKNMDSLKLTSYHGLNAETDARGEAVFNELLSADGELPRDSNGYIDMNALKAWSVDQRRSLNGVLNYERMIISSLAEGEENKKIIWEAFNEKDSGTTKMKSAESAVEQNAAHLMLIFDRLSSTNIQRCSIQNQVHYFDFQIQKCEAASGYKIAAGICKLLSLLCSLLSFIPGVGLIFSVLATVFSIAGALLDWGGAKVADGIDDEYRPSAPSDGSATEDVGEVQSGSLSDVQGLEHRENGLVAEVDEDYLFVNSDGNTEVSYGDLAGLTGRLTGVLNTMRLISQAREVTASAQRSLFQTFTGLRAGSSSPLIKGMLESSLAQSNVRMQAVQTYLDEIAMARTWEHQQDVAMDNATSSLVISMAVAVAAAVIAGCLGSISGAANTVIKLACAAFSIGQMIGSAVASYINARYGAWGNGNTSYGVEYDPDVDFVRKDDRRRNTQSDYERYLDGELNQIYLDMLNYERSIASAGDGRVGVNSTYLKALQQRLLVINNTIQLHVSSMEANAKARKALGKAFGTPVDSAEGIAEMANAKIESNMSTFATLRRLLDTKVEVMNRAADAEDEVTAATWKMCVSVVLGGVAIIVGPLLSNITTAFMGIVNSCMSVINAVIDLVLATIHAQEDFGAFDEYAKPDAGNKSQIREDSRRSSQPTDELLNMAADIDSQLSELSTLNHSYMESIGAGEWGVNLGMVSETQLAMEKLNRIAEILQSIIKAITEAQSQLTGIPSLLADATLSGAANNVVQSQLAALDHAVAALQTVAQRHNQMNEQTRQAWVAGIKGAIAVVSLALTCKQAITNQTAEQSGEVGERTEGGAEQREAQSAAQRLNEVLAWTSPLVSMLNPLLDMAVGAIYDAAKGDSSYDEGAAAENVQRAQASETRADNFAARIDAAEEATTIIKNHSSLLSLTSQHYQTVQQRMEAIVQQLVELIKSMLEYGAERIASELKQPEGGYVRLQQEAEAQQAEEADPAEVPEAVRAGEAGAAAPGVVAVPAARVPVAAREEQATPSTRVYVEALDHLLAQVTECDDQARVVQTQIDEVEQQQVAAAQQVRSQAEGERVDDPEELLARLQQRLVAVRAEREALVTEGNALQQEIARLREEMPRLLASAEREVEGMLGRDSRGETWVAAAREQLEGRIRGLEERATQLRARMDALRGEVRGLQRDIGSLQRQVAMAGALRRASGRQPDARDHYEDAMRDLAVVAGGGNAEGRTSMLGGYVC